MEQDSGVLSNHCFGNGHVTHIWSSGNGLLEASSESLPSKRKRNDLGNENGFSYNRSNGQETLPSKESLKQHRSFVLIDGPRGVYYSESWEASGSTLYLPVSGSHLANMDKYDQISFEQGCFCIGDAAGGFLQKAQGQAMHCWRYSEQEKKLFVALSYFFTDFQVFQDVVNSLGYL